MQIWHAGQRRGEGLNCRGNMTRGLQASVEKGPVLLSNSQAGQGYSGDRTAATKYLSKEHIQ